LGILELNNDLKLGFSVVHFCSEDNLIQNLDYSKKYSNVAELLQLYAMALRQIEPLYEFLEYCKILENCLGSSSKSSWIEYVANNLDNIEKFDFGYIEISDILGQNKKNLMEWYKKRAVERIRELKKKMNVEKIAEYFYVENRCGIAHGVRVKKQDFSCDYFTIYKDCYVLKMLSKMSIINKMNATS